MMFTVIVRQCPTDNVNSDRLIAKGWQWLCQDWDCPRGNHCAKHFGLSRRYAAMGEQPAKEALVCPTRRADGCDHFAWARRDHFAESLGERRVFPTVAQEGRA